jgi:DNA-binding NarL/FixJ family response regulator
VEVEIVATRLGAVVETAPDVVLVAVYSANTHLPPHEELMRRHGLTTREADVAVLLTRGLPRIGIAKALGLSAHTIRHHTEAVFRKLSVHNRSAVAGVLLRGQ